jgi:hypothetical protein
MDTSSTDIHGRIVAVREFRTEAGGCVTAIIYQPVLTRASEWKCAFRISGLPNEIEDYAFGVDAMQALIVGLSGLRSHLESIATTWTWAEGVPGDFGIPRSVPTGYGPEVDRHLAQVLSDEIAGLVARKANAGGRPWPPDKR